MVFCLFYTHILYTCHCSAVSLSFADQLCCMYFAYLSLLCSIVELCQPVYAIINAGSMFARVSDRLSPWPFTDIAEGMCFCPFSPPKILYFYHHVVMTGAAKPFILIIWLTELTFEWAVWPGIEIFGIFPGFSSGASFDDFHLTFLSSHMLI